MQPYIFCSDWWIDFDSDLNLSNLLTPSVFLILTTIIAVQDRLRLLFRLCFLLLRFLLYCWLTFFRFCMWKVLLLLFLYLFLLNLDLSFPCPFGFFSFFVELLNTSLRLPLVVFFLILIHNGEYLHVYLITSCLLYPGGNPILSPG